jgi:hypothetical protein
LYGGLDKEKVAERTDFKMNIPGSLMPETFDLNTLEKMKRISQN